MRMVRKLKYHEKKLLKKVDFISWKCDSNIREVKILRKYHIQKREDYTKYSFGRGCWGRITRVGQGPRAVWGFKERLVFIQYFMRRFV